MKRYRTRLKRRYGETRLNGNDEKSVKTDNRDEKQHNVVNVIRHYEGIDMREVWGKKPFLYKAVKRQRKKADRKQW